MASGQLGFRYLWTQLLKAFGFPTSGQNQKPPPLPGESAPEEVLVPQEKAQDETAKRPAVVSQRPADPPRSQRRRSACTLTPRTEIP